MTTTELITPPCAPSSLDAHLGASAPPTFDAASFHTLRPRLFGIACRVLGSAADADDVVQDTWIRWQVTDHSQIRDATGFLVTATTRLAMTVGHSARARRETSVGLQSVEPIDTRADPSVGPERCEALELAMRTLPEKLTPTERAVYACARRSTIGTGTSPGCSQSAR